MSPPGRVARLHRQAGDAPGCPEHHPRFAGWPLHRASRDRRTVCRSPKRLCQSLGHDLAAYGVMTPDTETKLLQVLDRIARAVENLAYDVDEVLRALRAGEPVDEPEP